MADPASGIGISFLAGVMTPLGAVCVLPLYPAFLAFLSGQPEGGGVRGAAALVTGGIMCSMLALGAVVILVWHTSLAGVLTIVAPIVYLVLAVAGVLLIAGIVPWSGAQGIQAPRYASPMVTAFVFGFFFGIVAMPCNPGPVLVLFALSLSPADAAIHLLEFVAFGIGMAAPLLVLSALPKGPSRALTRYLGTHRRAVQAVAGVFLLAVSVYYLLWFFAPWAL